MAKKPSNSVVTVKNKDIKGNSAGRLLFAVVTVDTDDTEDTTTELWRANSEDDLYELVKAEYLGEETDPFHEAMLDQFEDDWCFKILYKQIGKFN